jgi:UDP-2,3-diacylglucosamine pyrophosphatase LpxH
MSHDEKLTLEKLDSIWKDDKIMLLETKGKKYVLFSDLHFGDGGGADDFRKNEETLEYALEYYKNKNYTLLLIGDIEEFWQFDLEKVTERYNDTVYQKMRDFGDKRVIRIFGNHDREWGQLPDPSKNKNQLGNGAVEALKMKDKDGNTKILVIHGHQGSKESDKTSWFSRFFVRLYRSVEPLAKSVGITAHPEATKSQIVTNYEQIFYSWAKKQKTIIICGHSHRAIFASESYLDKINYEIQQLQTEIYENRKDKKKVKKLLRQLNKWVRRKNKEELRNRDIDPVEPDAEPLPCYFNTGCGLYSNGITAIEMATDTIRLVKWHRDRTKDPRFDVYGKGKLSSFIKKL